MDMGVVYISNKVDATIAETGAIYQDTDPGESSRLRGVSSERWAPRCQVNKIYLKARDIC